MNFGLEKVASSSTLKAVWICEKSEGIEPNYKISEASMKVGMINNSGDFSLSKPTKGWPVGSYRVDLYIDDKVNETAHFEVEK